MLSTFKNYSILVGRVAILFWIMFAFVLSGCASQTEPLDVGEIVTTTAGEPSPTTISPTTSPEPTDTPLPAATPTIPSPTPTLVEVTATATAIQITPHPGWVWHTESEAPGVLFQLPQTWDVKMSRPQRFQAPETNSIIEVRAFDFSGSDWLAWVQERESRLYERLSDNFVKQNGLVQGRPAFLFLKGGGGADAIALYVQDDDQIVNVYFQSGDVPHREEEMQVLLTMIETIQFASGDEGATTIPTGWVQGRMLTVYSLARLDFAGELQTITGTVATPADPPTFEATVVNGEDTSYRVDLSSYYGLGSLPAPLRPYPDTRSLRDLIQLGQPLTLTGYQSGQSPNERFYPLWGQTTGADGETVVLYRPFFDLHRFDPAILGEYPASVSLYLRGPWEQVQPYLVDEPNSPLPAEILALDSAQDVIVKGILQSTVPPRLTVEEFYHLDGDCELMRSDVQQCTFYQPVELAQ